MQIDPLTGEIVPSDSQQQVPLAFRMLENAPGFAAAAGFAAFRGSNTIMAGGGFLDDTRFGPLASNRAAKFRVFGESGLSGTNAKQYVGSSARRQRAAAANKQGFLRSSRVNNVTARPRALRRLHSLSVFGPASANMYTPFSASALASRSKTLTSKAGVQAGQDAFGPGLLSFVTAGRRADRLESRAGRSGARGARARAKLGNIDQSISRLAGMNNPTLIGQSGIRASMTNRRGGARLTVRGPSFSATRVAPVSQTKDPFNLLQGRRYFAPSQALPSSRISIRPFIPSPSFYDQSMAQAVSARTGVAAVGTTAPGTVGVRGNLLASSMAGTGTRFASGYFRGAMGFANVAGLEGKALEGAQKAVSQFTEALGGRGRLANKALEQGLFKTLGAKNVGKALMTKQGAAVIGARTIGMAIPGLNMVMAASLVYDLGKMAGEVVKSGVNLVRDADKSLRGTIHKPMFGMGYKDTEAAATSRSRGVMAIQNSRLNARSVLGSEAGMMAAHFG